LEYWKKFEDVEVLASIDESEALGEYIRKELNWEKFLANRESIRVLTNVCFKISPTVSVFNIKSLTEFYKKFLTLNLLVTDDIYINILDRPFHYSSKVLCESDKIEVTNTYHAFFKWCSDHNISQITQAQFQDCLDFMNFENHHSKYWPIFLSETKQLDKIRFEEYTNVK
jgi:hypothetical protein